MEATPERSIEARAQPLLLLGLRGCCRPCPAGAPCSIAFRGKSARSKSPLEPRRADLTVGVACDEEVLRDLFYAAMAPSSLGYERPG
jgi:hypothetical protein